jgi:prepilin-type N-terminal cleavage/methylation domain-containing protein
MKRHANGRGMTIIELMTVLIVLGVLMTLVAGPSMRGMAARHRVESVNAELLTDLQLARSELAQLGDASDAGVAISFGSNGQLSCYTVHTVVPAGSGDACDCTRAPGDACALFPPAREIKSMQFDRAVGISVAASSPTGPRILFAPPQGLVTPDGLVIDVQDTASGQLRTTVSGRGVPNVCSPDGSIRGVRTPC